MDSYIADKLNEKKKVNIDEIEDVDLKFALTGNRLGIPEFHIKSILDTLEESNVWIDLNLLEYFIEYLDELDGVQIIIEDGYNRNVAHSFYISEKSLSILLCLFGKFYGKKLSKKDSVFIGELQEGLLHETKYQEEDYKRAINIVEQAQQEQQKSGIVIPTINIFNKLIETLSFIGVDDFNR